MSDQTNETVAGSTKVSRVIDMRAERIYKVNR